MLSYPVGATVPVTIALIDQNGDPVTPTGLSYVVYDETDAVLVTATTIPVETPAQTEVSINVPGASNATAGGRLVELTITTDNGPIVSSSSYLIAPTRRLVLLDNTFQTYIQACLIAQTMPNQIGWLGAEKTDQEQALIEAYTRLVRFSYLIRWPENVDAQDFLHWKEVDRIIPQMWPLMTEELFDRYPASFRIALRKAQVAEANEILRGDKLGDKRRAGVFSESVGESKMMFMPGIRALQLGASRAALDYLKGYVDARITITRS